MEMPSFRQFLRFELEKAIARLSENNEPIANEEEATAAGPVSM